MSLMRFRYVVARVLLSVGLLTLAALLLACGPASSSDREDSDRDDSRSERERDRSRDRGDSTTTFPFLGQSEPRSTDGSAAEGSEEPSIPDLPSGSSETDRDALIALYEATNGDSWYHGRRLVVGQTLAPVARRPDQSLRPRHRAVSVRQPAKRGVDLELGRIGRPGNAEPPD